MYNSTHIPDVIQNDELMLRTVSEAEDVVYLQQNKKKAKAEGKKCTRKLCRDRKSRYNLYEKFPTCAA
jgi:hypothetical protein